MTVDLEALASELREHGHSANIFKPAGVHWDVRTLQTAASGFGCNDEGRIFFLGTHVDDVALEAFDIIRKHIAAPP